MMMGFGLFGLILLIYVFLILPTQWLKIEKVSYPAGLQVRFLQISDMHVERLRISPGRLNRIILEYKPDYILLTGDYTQRPRQVRHVAKYARAIMATGIPAYAVLGNHDYRLNRATLKKLLGILEDHRITVLRNQSVSLPGFDLLGIDDDDSGMSRISRTFRRTDPAKPAVIITHDPNVVIRIKQPFTYLMAGHLHGKQFNLPYLYKLKPKGELGRLGIYKGTHRTPYGTYYISKGIGQVGINMRFLVRSEITVHDL